jgi:hypothetical protein
MDLAQVGLHGRLHGFDDLFGTEYLVPVDQIAITGEKIVGKNMAPKQLEPAFPE